MGDYHGRTIPFFIQKIGIVIEENDESELRKSAQMKL
jgi:hypothetical protein